MEVLNTTSPVRSPWPPKARPRYTVPSSRARIASTSGLLLHPDGTVGDELPLVLFQGDEGHLGIVLEDEPKALARRLGKEALLALQGAQRLQVVPHDPGVAEMARRGDEVGQEEHRALPGGDPRQLQPGGVARG